MITAFKDKEGNIHVGVVSEAEGERIKREVASKGWAEPSESVSDENQNVPAEPPMYPSMRTATSRKNLQA